MAILANNLQRQYTSVMMVINYTIPRFHLCIVRMARGRVKCHVALRPKSHVLLMTVRDSGARRLTWACVNSCVICKVCQVVQSDSLDVTR